MPLSPGTRFGPYEIAATIGIGGMGEVYRATDSRLKRDVAIKVLPQYFAADADRVARFQREAEMLAALNHQNIAHIYGLERRDETTALVMELVDGPTLADRLARGAIPLDEALPIAMQIADALEAAHERGIVHRDLKPANVKLRPDGTVKVLDFGIAKVLQPFRDASGPQTTVVNTPTFTQLGMILGTAAYMSPEQARGKPIDKRTDIWAFGCVLYEMLAGQPAFDGEDATVTVGRVLEREPDMSALPFAVPPSVRQVLSACLRKDPKKRLRDIGDVKLALEGAFETRGDAAVDVRSAWRSVPIAAALFVGAAVAGLAAWRLSPVPEARVVTRLSEPISIAAGAPFLSVSHDGERVGWSGPSGIHVRRLDDFAAQPVPGFEDAGVNRPPCFSPDGTWIAYRTADRIKRMPVGGGTALTLADGVVGGQCHWGDDGYVYFLSNDGISRVAEAGGTPETVATRDAERGESAYFAPQLLPGGRTLLFSMLTSEGENDPRVTAVDLKTHERKSVLERAAYVGYVSLRDDQSALLVYLRDDTLFSAPFDLARVEAGAGRPVLGFPAVTTAVVSPSGTLAYLPAGGDGLLGDASLTSP
jgi:eukaryotic-like serine/threonine-protein kinase